MPTVTRTKTKDAPETVKPFVLHGLDLAISGDEAVGDCPFCGREGKFSVNVGTGMYRCLICAEGTAKGGGNVYTFIRKLYEISVSKTTQAHLVTLASERGIEFPKSLMDWGLAKSVTNGRWLVPGYAADPNSKLQLQQLYSYTRVDGRMLLLPTPGLKHCLLGVNLYDFKKAEVQVAEGIWDGIRLYEVLSATKQGADGKFSSTTSKDACLLASMNVVAAPSCSAFGDTWGRWFKDKEVTFLFDNDYPKTNPKTGDLKLPAGMEGTQRAVSKIKASAGNIYYLSWGPEGFDPKLADGYDIRDALKNKANGLELIVGRTEPVPEEWISAVTSAADLHCRSCTSWNQLILSWRKALKWTEGLEHALAMMLSCIASTNSIGDQLWAKIMGPASCGKSTLCEALSINKQYVIAKSTIRGFHSGYKSSPDAKEDNSLIVNIKGRTLITKDGDTLLQSPNLGQILSEARDLYDSVSRTHYRNKMSKDYEGIRMTWLLCGTNSLRDIDSSELGQRFLDCVIMEKIDTVMEDEILWRVANRAAEHVDIEANGDVVTQNSPEMMEAMQLTGGYVSWLRENAAIRLPQVKFSNEAKQECIHIGKFVAYMRARPSRKKAEKAERELAARLVSQHIRLAKCMALVLNRTEVDSQVMKRVRQVGMDTSRGAVLDMMVQIYKGGNAGMSTNALKLFVDLDDAELRRMLKFNYRIGMVMLVKKSAGNVWQLTPELMTLCKEML